MASKLSLCHGHFAEAEAEVRRALESDPCDLFQVTAALDGLEDALPYLEEASEVRSFFPPYLGVLPPHRSFHHQRRFRAVLEKVWPGTGSET